MQVGALAIDSKVTVQRSIAIICAAKPADAKASKSAKQKVKRNQFHSSCAIFVVAIQFPVYVMLSPTSHKHTHHARGAYRKEKHLLSSNFFSDVSESNRSSLLHKKSNYNRDGISYDYYIADDEWTMRFSNAQHACHGRTTGQHRRCAIALHFLFFSICNVIYHSTTKCQQKRSQRHRRRRRQFAFSCFFFFVFVYCFSLERDCVGLTIHFRFTFRFFRNSHTNTKIHCGRHRNFERFEAEEEVDGDCCKIQHQLSRRRSRPNVFIHTITGKW